MSVAVLLPTQLRQLAHCARLVHVDPDALTLQAVLDALEQRYPQLLGTMRDQQTGQRRAFIRFYACEEDLSHEPPDAPLPDAVATGSEPLLVVGAMAGG